MSLVPPADDSERQLALQLRTGDEAAIATLLEVQGSKVNGYLRRRFPSFDETELYDLLVDAIMIFRQTFDPQQSSAGAWLLLLAHQQAVNRLRAKKQGRLLSLQTLELEPAGHLAAPQARLEEEETVLQLQEALQDLAPLERKVIEADLEAGSAANARQLAEQHKTTEHSIYAARNRARKKLARAWERKTN